MSFNIAVSGLNAAHKRMEVSGNNIANVGTTGFKSSRAEFSAVYSSSVLDGSRSTVGDGVRLANVSQDFAPGGVESTSGRPLDMRIQGKGFFVMNDGGTISYTRAGAFHLDAESVVVDAHGGRLQGYGVNADGQVISGVRGDLKLDLANISPKATSKLEQTLNLDAGASSLAAIRRFNPDDPTTYTRMVTRTIQDAATPPQDHELKQYFVKANDNDWTSYILVDGLNPLNPSMTSALEVGLRVSPTGKLSMTGTEAAVKINSDTELSLEGWKPAVKVNGSWTASPSAAPGPVSLSLEEGGAPLLDPADALIPRPVPAFDPKDVTTYNKAFTYAMFDTLGNRHEMSQYFVKDGSNSWKMHVLIDGRNPQDPARTDPLTASMLFDGKGSLQALTAGQGLVGADGKLTLDNWVPAKPGERGKGGPWIGNGATGNAEGIVLDLSKLTQHRSDTASLNVVVDGHAAGQANEVSVDRNGMVSVGFTNGLRRGIGQVVLASFANDQGLQPVSDTRWVETYESGIANYEEPGVGTMGGIVSRSLEGSNVNLSEELVTLIQAQMAYQANSKTLSAESEILQTLIRAT
ncbi:flagellar hook protein FlgE [Pseudomonas sp. NPDC090202]|uniref:flagellar hook protein FlgE n=1 Tax=unclassified Pseudomonas TaxID=196821 RepID=UPI00381D02E7